MEWLPQAHVLELLVPADVAILRGCRTFGTWGLVGKRRHRGTSWLQPSVASVFSLCFLLHSVSSHSHSKNPADDEPHSTTADGKLNFSDSTVFFKVFCIMEKENIEHLLFSKQQRTGQFQDTKSNPLAGLGIT